MEILLAVTGASWIALEAGLIARSGMDQRTGAGRRSRRTLSLALGWLFEPRHS